jgi:type II secretory pathway component PulF
MEKVYKYTGIDPTNGEFYERFLIAASMDDAYDLLNKMGTDFMEMKLDVRNTISLSKNLPLKDLARFYDTMGKRMAKGGQFATGLESAMEFIKDLRLRIYISMLLQAILEGRKIGESMELANFPDRHAKAIAAMEESGQVPDTFISLAEECRREHNLTSSMVSLMRSPKAFMVIVLIMFYGAFGFMSPMMLGQLEEIVGYDNMPGYARDYLDFVTLFSENLIISTILYFGIVVGLYMSGKSKFAKKLANKVKIINTISERGDQASLWLKYGLMFSSAMNLQEAAILVAQSAKRDDSKEFFYNLESYIASGYSIGKAVEMSGFPQYVVGAIKSGESSEGIGDAMKSLSVELFEDVDMLISQLTDTVKTIMIIVMSIVVVIFFLLTYYPLLSTMMGQL